MLADYQDSGQGLVIPLVFSFYDGVWGLFGRWRNEGYSPFAYSTSIELGSFTLGTHDPSHPLMEDVTEPEHELPDQPRPRSRGDSGRGLE